MTFNRKKNLRTFDRIEDIKFIPDDNFDGNQMKMTIPNGNFDGNQMKMTIPDGNFDANQMKMTIPDVKSKKSLYYIENVLTKLECEKLVEITQNKYSTLKHEFLPSEREGNRLLTNDETFAQVIFERIKKFIFQDPKLIDLKPCGFGVDGEWKVDHINPCFRYNQYISPSVGFKAHRDATYIHNEDIRSILTLLIYINDDFEGGDTVFYDTYGTRTREDLVDDELKRGYTERFRYKPKTGSVLIFNHNMIHEGEALSHGTKYVIRSDVVFKRPVKPPSYDAKWKNDPNFLKAIDYFRRAINCELDGNIKDASIYYQKELAIRQTCN
jgi:hypothetical protein